MTLIESVPPNAIAIVSLETLVAAEYDVTSQFAHLASTGCRTYVVMLPSETQARHTALEALRCAISQPVTVAQSNMDLSLGCVYIVPPNCLPILDGQRLYLIQESAIGDHARERDRDASRMRQGLSPDQINRSLQQLYQLGTETYDNLETLFTAYARVSRDCFDLDGVILGRLEGGMHVIEFTYGASGGLVAGQVLPAYDAVWGTMTECQETITCAFPMGSGLEPGDQESSCVWVYIRTPIVVRGTLYGVLCFTVKHGQDLEFHPTEYEMIESISRAIGHAIGIYRVQTELAELKGRYDLVLQGAGGWLWDWDIQRDRLVVTQEGLDLFGRKSSVGGVSLKSFQTVVHSDDRDRVCAAIKTHLEQRQPFEIECRMYRSNQSLMWVQITGQALWNDNEEPIRMAGSVHDISRRKRAERKQQQLEIALRQALSNEQKLAQCTLASIEEGVITTNTRGAIVYMNPSAEMMTGWGAEKAQGKALEMVFLLIDEQTQERLPNPLAVIAAIAVNDSSAVSVPLALEVAIALRHRDGQQCSIEGSITPLHQANGRQRGHVIVFRNVSQTRLLTAKLSWEASHDALTGLLNRRYFEQQLDDALTQTKESDEAKVLCYLDLDRFQIINDACGHLAGDRLLQQIGQTIQHNLRECDTLARLGGDEFGVILHQCNLEIAHALAECIRQAVEDFRFVWEGKSFGVAVSIGLVEFTRDIDDWQTLLRMVDTACYAAKNRGRNRIRTYQVDSMELIAQHQEHRWSIQIRRAIEEHRFCLYRQPIVTSQAPYDTPYRHYEVLLRMRDEQGNILSPGTFIPAAERYDLMPTIDRWIVRQSFELLSRSGTSPEGMFHSINLSGTSINDESFLHFLQNLFQQYAVLPSSICFEITETSAIGNLNQASEFMMTLRDLGCKFALDDFGSGMSSFGYLKQLPIDFLKIDGSFVRDIETDTTARAIVQSIHHVGHVMGIETIAEFVENDAIVAHLQEMGIDYLQGYGIAMPEPWI